MSRPNILWICTDSQRWDALGCYGNEYVRTPNIDGLADEGMRFERVFSQSPVCTPSRASFLTGRYPVTTRCRKNGQEIPDDEVLVTRLLADEKYTCGLAGKMHLGPCEPDGILEERTDPYMERRIDDGYAEFHWSHAPHDRWPTNEYIQWLHDQDVELERETHPDSEFVKRGMPAEYHDTTWTADRTVSFIERNESYERPWLFSVNIFDPHFDFDPPAEYLERYEERLDDVPLPNYEEGELNEKPWLHREKGEQTQFPEMDETDHRLIRAAYWAMCDLIDDQVGRMLDALDSTGQREDTIVIFTSDHGEMLGDHGMYKKGPFFYEGAVRVPLVVSYPGTIPEGAESSALVELSDLAPTLLDAADLEPYEGMQTKSLWPILTGAADPDDHRDDVYCEYYNAKSEDSEPESATMLRTDRYKLVRYHRIDTGELYDYDDDPTETRNRWDDPAYEDVKADLLGRLSDRMADTADPLPKRKGIY